MKLHFIDRLETKLSKAEIEETLKEITVPNEWWNLNVKCKLSQTKFENNTFSFFYLAVGRHDMLSPKIHGKIVEGEEGCMIELFYSGTWEFVILFIWWSFISWISVKMSIINIICHFLFYILGFWVAKTHCVNKCNKVVNILKMELNPDSFCRN